MFNTFRADDFFTICNEPSAHQGGITGRADEAVIVPVAVLKADEARAPHPSDGFLAREAAFRKHLAKALRTVGFRVSGSKSLPCERGVAVGTRETFLVPRVILVRDAATYYDFIALLAFGDKFIFVACDTINFLVFWNETFCTYHIFADSTAETFFVPLLVLILHLFGTRCKYFIALEALGSIVGIVTLSAEYFVLLRPKGYPKK